MAITPSVQVATSSDCGTLTINDISTYTGGSDKVNVSCRSISIKDPCGNELVAGGVAEVECLVVNPTVSYVWDFSAYSPTASEPLYVDDFEVNGANQLSVPITAAGANLSAQLTSLASQLDSALSAFADVAFSSTATTLTATARENILGDVSGFLDDSPIGAQFVESPDATISFTASGSAPLRLVICGRMFDLTSATEFLVQPSLSLGVDEAFRASRFNILTALFEKIQPHVADISCECGVTITAPTCDTDTCGIKLTATPGKKVVDYTWSSGAAGEATSSITTSEVCTWKYAKTYTWGSLASSGTAGYPNIVVDGVSVATGITTAAGATQALRVADLAAQLNLLGIGTFSADTVNFSISVTSESEFGSLEVTDPGSSFVLPTIALNNVTTQDTYTQAITCDGRYCITLAIYESLPDYAQATVTLPDEGFTLEIPVVSSFPGWPLTNWDLNAYDEAIVATHVVNTFNDYVQTVLGLTAQEMYATSSSDEVTFFVSLEYLESLGNPSTCGSTTLTIELTPDSTTIAEVTNFDDQSCVAGTDQTYCTTQCFSVLCRAECKLQEILLHELKSCRKEDECLPVSQELNDLMRAFNLLISRGEDEEAQSIMKQIAQVANLSLCQPNDTTSSQICNC